MTAYAAKKFQENATTKTSLTSMLNACSVSKHFYTKASQLNCMADAFRNYAEMWDI